MNTCLRKMVLCVLLGCGSLAATQKSPETKNSHDPGISTRNHRVITAGSPNVNHSTPGVAVVPNGDFLAIYNKTLADGTTYHSLRRSTDHGLTWGAEILQWDASSPDPTLWTTPGTRLFVEFGKRDSGSVSGAAWSVSGDSGYT